MSFRHIVSALRLGIRFLNVSKPMEISDSQLPVLDGQACPEDLVPRKYVFAHFMVGNTYPYGVQDWLDDIQLASQNGMDGFVLNVGHENWQYDCVGDCFAASLKTSQPFVLMLSFDMSSIPSSKATDVALLRRYISGFGNHARMFRMDGKVVISTFAGENSLFGQPSLDTAWEFVKKNLSTVVPVALVPSFFIDPARFKTLNSIDGAFNWNGGWPIHLTTASPRQELEFPALTTDQPYVQNLGKRIFMAAISPWFFTHYGPDTWNKNWMYRGDDWLFARRWEQVIAMRDQINIAQVISWNDYGESHYIGRIKGAQPNSQAWVDGFPHTAWLHLNAYYARAFRDGQYPPVKKDKIYVWARPHPRDADAPDNVSPPKFRELTDDVFWVLVLSSAPADLRISTNNQDGLPYQVPAGITKLSHPLRVGCGMSVIMRRGGKVVAECQPTDFIFQEKPLVYNFNAYVAMSA